MSFVLDNSGAGTKRLGECLRCGACGCEKLGCLHFTWRDGLATCLIYDRRDIEVCEECTAHASQKHGKRVVIGHRQCIGFPSNPRVNVITTGVCGYSFVVEN